MNVEELRTFLEVIETGSLVKASRRLNVTQSTVTARINALEEEVGQKLLHRYKSGVELTSPGFKFKRYAEVMTQLWRQARHEISLPAGFAGICNVGLEFDLWNSAGRAFLEFVRALDPPIAVALWPGGQQQIDRWLSIGLVDIAFCFAPQSAEGFSTQILFDDELVLISADRNGNGDDLFVDHGDEFRRQFAVAFPNTPISPVTIASSDWALDVMLTQGGKGYLPQRHVRAYLDRGRLFQLAEAPSFTRRVYVVEAFRTTRDWTWLAAALVAVRTSAKGQGSTTPLV